MVKTDAAGVRGTPEAPLSTPAAVTQQSGKINGHAFVPRVSVQSLILSQAEEMPQQFSEKRSRDRAAKELRSLSNTARVRVEKVEEAEELQDAIKQVPDAQARKAQIESLAELIIERQAGGGFTDSEGFQEFVLENWNREREKNSGAQGEDSPDATELYAVLSHLETLIATEHTDLGGLAKEAANSFFSKHGREINKGLAISETAAVYVSQTMGTAPQLRILYMDQVADQRSIRQSFTDIMQKYGAEGYGVAVEYLIRAAGDDMAAMSAINDKEMQKDKIDSLYELEVLKTVHERTETTLERLRIRYELSDEASAFGVMESVFVMIETPYLASESRVTELATAVVVDDAIAGRISFLRELRNNIVAIIPYKVFDEKDTDQAIASRTQVLKVIGEAQDLADEQEQDSLEERTSNAQH